MFFDSLWKSDLDWNLDSKLENCPWIGLEKALKGFPQVLAQEKRWVGEYEESISIEDIQTRNSYNALHNARILSSLIVSSLLSFKLFQRVRISFGEYGSMDSINGMNQKIQKMLEKSRTI